MAAASTIVRPGAWAARRPAAAQEARLRLLIASGGDDRIWLDPTTRRNRYGVPAEPAPDELWFSSSTACAVSPRGWAAAGEALERLTEPGCHTIAAFFEALRLRLLALYGAPGAEAVLAASGTEAELVTLSLALSLAQGPVVNIVVAPAETGSGVPAAASGQHFLGRASLGGPVAKASRLTGWEDAQVTLETIEIRGPGGALRAQADVDQEAALKVERAVAGGAFALLHVLDASKTGRPGVSRAAASKILARYPERVLVVVDACQLRCAAADVRADLERGLAVMVTGSKFAGGPAFCGALLLPAVLAERLAQAAQVNAGPPNAALAPYSAALDWPARLRRRFAAGLAHPANLGLGLRWSAALAEIEAYEAVPAEWRAAMLADFDRAVRARVAADPGLTLADDGAGSAPGLVPIFHTGGADPRAVYEALTSGEGARRPCHLGQPVAVGAALALRVCASMPMIAGAAEHGFAAIESDLDEAFESWARLRG
ncbi:MAG TPA: hypothetical protein VN814_17490 [Caulobacteraceae bacterium]|nr:hypothetical protein [Caulobacteraceae bacterium]